MVSSCSWLMKRKGALVKFNPVDSHLSGNLKSPDPDDKRIRLERRWRRRETMVDSLKHNRVASASKTDLKICGSTDVLIDKNDHTLDGETDDDWKTFLATYTSDDDDDDDDDDEMNEDYRSFLATYNSEIEYDCASDHSGGSNVGNDETDAEYISFLATYDPDVDVENESAGNQSGGSNIGSDEMDAEYISFLATYDPNVENDSAGNQSGGSNIGNDETDAEYISFLATYDPDVENDFVGNQSGGSNVDINFGNSIVKEEIEEGYNCFSNQFVSDYVSNGVHVDEYDRLLRKSFCVGQNSLVSEQDTPEVQCVDEDYERFLNSGWTSVEGDFVYGCDKNTKNTSNMKNESSSSDSDVIVLESYPNCENTPFVSSKAYDSSCFGEEMHPKDNMQVTSFHHSQFRKRLMEYLDRPYDCEEYKSLLAKANERRKKERHLGTRRGAIESYHYGGVTKSYLDSHPDFAKAIATESKENRILFLLRGFFFWLQNAEGKFQPWLDELCLEKMRRM
ncbi:hypothetical protein RYX36_022094 [Vicia faba]